MTTPDSDRVALRAAAPAAVLALVPYLLEFTPESSFVVIGARDDGLVKLTLRYDLPSPGENRADEIAEHAVAVLLTERVTSAVVAGYGTDEQVRPVAQALLREADGKLRVHDILRVHDGRRYSLTCTNITCCPPSGTPFDPPDHGLPSRAELAGTLSPDDSTAEEMCQATARAANRIGEALTAKPGTARRRISREALGAVAQMIGYYRAGGTCQDADQWAWLSVVLRDQRIRDDAWARMDPDYKGAHLRLWTDLTRRARPGYVAAPASLLAFTAWQAGNGALANLALDRALDDDPAYSMAGLLRDVLAAGAPPSLARPPMTPEQVADEYDAIEEPGPAGHDDEAPPADDGQDRTEHAPADRRGTE